MEIASIDRYITGCTGKVMVKCGTSDIEVTEIGGTCYRRALVCVCTPGAVGVGHFVPLRLLNLYDDYIGVHCRATARRPAAIVIGARTQRGLIQGRRIAPDDRSWKRTGGRLLPRISYCTTTEFRILNVRKCNWIIRCTAGGLISTDYASTTCGAGRDHTEG